MNKTVLWIILAISAVFFLYPSITTLLDVLQAIGNASTVTGAVAETRDRAIMQVLGFISLYVFLGFLLYSYKYPSNEQMEIDNNEDRFPHFSITLNPLYSVAIGALTILGAIALQYFAGLIDTSEIVSGIAQPIAIAIITGLIVGLVAFMIIDKLNENEE